MAKKKSGRGGKREGAGRPVGADGHVISITVCIPDSIVMGLAALCEKEGWNRSEGVTEAIRRLLKRKRGA